MYLIAFCFGSERKHDERPIVGVPGDSNGSLFQTFLF